MTNLIYSLAKSKENSLDYYQVIKEVAKSVNKEIYGIGERYINEFMIFLKENKVEKLRSVEEYSIEFMLIGVLIQEYIDNARAFKNTPLALFSFFNNMRDKKGKNKKQIDKIRGVLISKYLLKQKNGGDEYNFNDFIVLIKWLKAAYEFKEQVLRLENWLDFLKTKKITYSNRLIGKTVDASLFLNEVSDHNLANFLCDIESLVNKNYKIHKNKEDIIFCTEGRIQYYFNMVSAQIMNEVYNEKYIKCAEKMYLVPTCMRQTKSKCQSVKTINGYKCKGCTNECNVNKLDKLGLEKGFRVYSIGHESSLFRGKNRRKINTGVTGVACILNLMSGGWKAVRLGYIPQCILLQTCGCSNHWREEDVMTDINWNKII